MYTHVVFFYLRRTEDIQAALETLRGLEGRVPSLRGIEVGVDDAPGERSAHICLITRFDDPAGLQAYQVHPVHQAALVKLKGWAERTAKVDFSG